jgi:tetratricopeptide (TPR) repeat protein
MAPVHRTIGLVFILALVAHPAWAQPAVSGSYLGEKLGRLELSTEQERVVGYSTEAGACGFEPRRQVLQGELQGNVLVGSLTLCVQGNTCPPGRTPTFPILAFYNPEDRSLALRVRLKEGCTSPALNGEAMLVLQPGSEGPAPLPSRQQGGASGVARKRSVEAAKEERDLGIELLAQQKWQQSQQHFERSISLDDSNWIAFLGLGTARLMQGNAQEAVTALERSRDLNPNYPDTYYNLACAYSRLRNKAKALESLRQAVGLGYSSQEAIFQDEPLNRFLGGEPEFLGLAQQAFENGQRSQARRQPTGQ